MSYRLAWLPSAQDTLFQIVIRRPDPAAIVNALNRVAETLQQEGPSAGESRERNLRVFIELPLGVKFRVDELDRVVTITDIWAVK